ncbi:hypothetical protein OAT18_03820, partial [Tenacibaculum sp.]|nr:hypothetical protein [Tenacibaculum sp.]
MNLQNVQKSLGFLSIIGMLLFASCESNEGIGLETTQELEAEEVQNMVLVSDVSDDIDDILEDDAELNNFAKKEEDTNDCKIRSVEETANGKIVTLDFGQECLGKRGRKLSGKIIIEYFKDDNEKSKKVTFEGFSVNGRTIEGSKSFSKMKENLNGNPEFTKTFDIVVTFKNGDSISKKGTKIKEQIEGKETDSREDNVYAISGNWEFVNKDGNIKSAVIKTNLIRKYSCEYIVSGVVEIAKGERSFTLDFGDGTCDNKATVTNSEGTVKEIF